MRWPPNESGAMFRVKPGAGFIFRAPSEQDEWIRANATTRVGETHRMYPFLRFADISDPFAYHGVMAELPYPGHGVSHPDGTLMFYSWDLEPVE